MHVGFSVIEWILDLFHFLGEMKSQSLAKETCRCLGNYKLLGVQFRSDLATCNEEPKY